MKGESMKKSICAQLNEKKKELESTIRQIRSRMKTAPEGSLNISMDHGHPRYYWNKVKDGKRKKYYLNQEQRFKICMLAQKALDEQMLTASYIQVDAIESFMQVYDEKVLQDICAALSPARKELVGEVFEDDDTYARRWEAVSYEPGQFEPGAPVYYTLKGERVRSKSEKIIADTLYSKGIPYRYEYPLRLKDGRMWRPDFMILNKTTREEFYLEHFGMLDDVSYCANALGKLSIFMENGLFPGEKLLITAESSAKPFSPKDLDRIIEHYLL